MHAKQNTHKCSNLAALHDQTACLLPFMFSEVFPNKNPKDSETICQHKSHCQINYIYT